MQHMTLKSIIADQPRVLYAQQTVAEALEMMAELLISSVIIIDEDNHPIGIFTERDALRVVADDLNLHSLLIDIMTMNPFCVEETILVHDAYMKMEEKGYRHLVVVDESGQFVGVVSEGDFLRHIGFEELGKFKIVSEVMSISPLIIACDAPLAEAAALMHNRKCDNAIILDGSHPIGVITERDITHWRAQDKSAMDTTVEKLLHRDFHFIQEGVTLQEAAVMMENHGVHQIIVVDGDGSLVGLLSRHDVLHAVHGAYFEFLMRVIDQKNNTISKIEERKSLLEYQSAFAYTLINTIPDMVWLKDLDGIYLACNPMFENFFGAKESEIIGKSDFDFVDAELAQSFRDHDRVAIAAGGSRTNEEVLTFADGSYTGTFDTVKTLMKNGDGDTIGVLGISRDISERKRKDEEITQVQAMAHIGTWEWDMVQDLFTGSEESYRIFGIPMGKTISFSELLRYFAPEDQVRVKNQLLNRVKDQPYEGSIYKIIHEDGESRWIKTHTSFIFDAAQTMVKSVGILQDISDHIRYEDELRRKDADLNAAQALAHIGNWRLDVRKNTLEWSDETYRIFGIEIGTPLTYELFLSVIHPEDMEIVDRAWKKALWGDDYEIEHRILVNGEIKWVREHARLEIDEEGKLCAGIGSVQLITERKLYEERLETLANYDPLTGLANRALLLSHLQNSIEQAKRHKTQIALLMFDLDRFKDINDSYGHSAGDELLQLAAKRFTSRLRDGDLISRLGGDEFAVVLENLARPEDAGRLAEEMIRTLSAEYKLSKGASIHIGTSVGIVLFPDHGDESSVLLQHADAALYKAKSEGRGIYHYYTDGLTDLARKRIECETRLRRAVINREFEVYYQPQVHITTGRIVGAEALVRWNDPERGLISPMEFIPIAEETGLIGEIGEWVLNETCRQGKLWLDQGHRLTLAVNISAHQVRHQNIPLMVERALKKSLYPADRLELEITESALMQREEETVVMLHSLRAQGIRLAIDDFGTGYSSLSYLKRFPIDVLKIDKSFVDDIPFDSDDMSIVTAIIAMGQALGFQVLAEGTERPEQIEFLKEKGCAMYQGYFKSKPVPAVEFEKLLM